MSHAVNWNHDNRDRDTRAKCSLISENGRIDCKADITQDESVCGGGLHNLACQNKPDVLTQNLLIQWGVGSGGNRSIHTL
jgi:hypothetical protein